MSIFKWFKRAKDVQHVDLMPRPLRGGGGGGYNFEVVGESYCQDNLRRALESVGAEVDAVLVPEPNNKYDSNAVRVDVVVDGVALKAGYVPRDRNYLYQGILLRGMKRGEIGTCKAKIFGHDMLGIWLDLTDEPYYGLFKRRGKSDA